VVGVRGQPQAATWIEAVERLHQAEAALRHQIADRDAQLAIAQGERDDVSEVRIEHSPASLLVSVLQVTHGQRQLLRLGELRNRADQRQKAGGLGIHALISHLQPPYML